MSEQMKRYLHSSAVTFLTTFVILLAFNLNGLDFNTLEQAGSAGFVMVLARAFLKAVYEASVMLIGSWASKLKK